MGRRIAEETAARLRLPSRDAETLRFLVHKHLIMSHLAFRRDTSDDQLIVRFAVEVGSTEWLRMLFVLTCADLAAVGPGVLSSWKAEVLHDLYLRTLRHLSGDSPSLLADERRSQVKATLRRRSARPVVRSTNRRPSLFLSYKHAAGTGGRGTASAAKTAHRRSGGVASHRAGNEDGRNTRSARTKTLRRASCYKLTGALSSQGLQILSADINTLVDGLVLDRFRVQDPDYAGEPPPERQQEIERCLRESLISGQVPPFRRVWRAAASKSDAALPGLPTQVRVDNSHLAAVHHRRCIRVRSHGFDVHDDQNFVRAGAFRVAGENQHLS